jgi:glycosyltransferase involved in cell wall biosynthesis
MTKIAVFATHPIQYQAPWFRALAATPGLEIVVHFERTLDNVAQGAGFGVPFEWDVPLLSDFAHTIWLPAGTAVSGQQVGLTARAAAVWRLIRKERPDVALVLGWEASWLRLAALVGRLSGVPLLVRGDSNAVKKRPPLVRAVHRTYLSQFDRFLTVGRSNRQFYARYGVPDDRMFECPHFVDVKRFASETAQLRTDHQRLRSALGIAPAACVFLFAGKLQRKKRPQDFIHACAKAHARGDSVHALVVGDGDLRGEVEALACHLGLPVTLTGFLNQSEIPRAYAVADVLVLPSDAGETWGLVVNEAMASGLPAIVSDAVGCAPDLIIHGETGFVFPMGDVAALADAVRRMCASPSARESMGRRARTHVCGAYTVEHAVAGVVDAVSSLGRSTG